MNTYRRFFLCVLIIIAAFPALVFSQSAGVLRDYVGLINQTYHPDIVSYFEKIKADLDKKGEVDAVKALELFLRGSTGSGFVINAGGTFYILTNYHVIAQAYRLSITFERQDGYKRVFENLKIIAADEETDLALLAFASGDRPVAGALQLLTRAVEEGEDVYSAGFPSLGVTPLWQFGRGMVSNATARFPKSLLDETLMGPFIQHTAQVDPGNSGGPLLIVQRNAPGGYVVAGVNTLSALWRQAANYAIPVNTVRPFINNAVSPKSETWRAALDKRLENFTGGLGENKAVYPHIAEFLSSACVGENAEYAITELFEKGNRTVQREFLEKFSDSVVGAMGYAVAWTIENSIRGQGAIKAAIKEVTGSNEEYTVIFTINNKDFSSLWVRDYGNWRIKTFGEVAAGNKTLLTQQEEKRKNAENIRIKEPFNVEGGYAFLFEKGSALYASLNFWQSMGVRIYFAGSDFWSVGAFGQFRGIIEKGAIAIMPYGNLGVEFQHDKALDDYKKENRDGSGLVRGFPMAFAIQGGIKFTTSKVPGLYGGAGFQYNVFTLNDNPDPMKMAVLVMAGYSF
ncbi:MAG: serine protease [Spirochaetaceae bacterium]|jgi:serine protease Do|nr:serine protease [Spirochaetaceae bacterium]